MSDALPRENFVVEQEEETVDAPSEKVRTGLLFNRRPFFPKRHAARLAAAAAPVTPINPADAHLPDDTLVRDQTTPALSELSFGELGRLADIAKGLLDNDTLSVEAYADALSQLVAVKSEQATRLEAQAADESLEADVRTDAATRAEALRKEVAELSPDAHADTIARIDAGEVGPEALFASTALADVNETGAAPTEAQLALAVENLGANDVSEHEAALTLIRAAIADESTAPDVREALVAELQSRDIPLVEEAGDEFVEQTDELEAGAGEPAVAADQPADLEPAPVVGADKAVELAVTAAPVAVDPLALAADLLEGTEAQVNAERARLLAVRAEIARLTAANTDRNVEIAALQNGTTHVDSLAITNEIFTQDGTKPAARIADGFAQAVVDALAAERAAGGDVDSAETIAAIKDIVNIVTLKLADGREAGSIETSIRAIAVDALKPAPVVANTDGSGQVSRAEERAAARQAAANETIVQHKRDDLVADTMRVFDSFFAPVVEGTDATAEQNQTAQALAAIRTVAKDAATEAAITTLQSKIDATSGELKKLALQDTDLPEAPKAFGQGGKIHRHNSRVRIAPAAFAAFYEAREAAFKEAAEKAAALTEALAGEDCANAFETAGVEEFTPAEQQRYDAHLKAAFKGIVEQRAGAIAEVLVEDAAEYGIKGAQVSEYDLPEEDDAVVVAAAGNVVAKILQARVTSVFGPESQKFDAKLFASDPDAFAKQFPAFVEVAKARRANPVVAVPVETLEAAA